MAARCVLVAIAVAGCSASPLAVSRGAITNGAEDTGDPAVVMVVNGQTPVCSGFVVHPHAVLTAAHCLVDNVNFDQFAVEIDGQPYDLIDAYVDPLFDAASFAHDVSVLVLRQPTMVTPLPIDGRMTDASLVGQSFTVIGYGSSAAGTNDYGVKRKGTAMVTAVGALDFTAAAAPSQPCAVDSGGPALFVDGSFQVVTGMVSHGDEGCSDHAVFTRLDVARSEIIDPVLQKLGPGTSGLGERCYYDDQCRSGPCLTASDEPKRAWCSKDCQRNEDCAPSMMVCLGGACRYAAPSPGSLGAACSDGSECAGGLCQASQCAQRCVLRSDCPGGYSCKNSSGIEFSCVKDPVVVESGCAVGGSDGSGLMALGCVAWIWARRRRRGWSRPRAS